MTGFPEKSAKNMLYFPSCFLMVNVLLLFQHRLFILDAFQNSMPRKLNFSMNLIRKSVSKYESIPQYPVSLEIDGEQISFGQDRRKRLIWEKGRWYFQILDHEMKIKQSYPFSEDIISFDKLKEIVDLMAKNEKKINEKYFYFIKFNSDTSFQVWARLDPLNPHPVNYHYEIPFVEIYWYEFIDNKWQCGGGGIDSKGDEEETENKGKFFLKFLNEQHKS